MLKRSMRNPFAVAVNSGSRSAAFHLVEDLFGKVVVFFLIRKILFMKLRQYLSAL